MAGAITSRLARAARRLSAASDIAARGAVVDALFFDAGAYCEENQDVAQSVDAGKVRSFYDHYVRYGKWEGRRFALRRWGLSDAAAMRLFVAAARLEAQLDALACRLSYGELGHTLVSSDGSRLFKPIGPWKPQLDRGPWWAELPHSARAGGWFMLSVRVAPVRAPLAFRVVGHESACALFCKPTRSVQRMLRLPAGSERLEIELLDQRLRAQPLRVRLRRVPDDRVETRMLRRLCHHHRRYLGRGDDEVRESITREAAEDGGSLRELMWEAYESTFPPPVAHAGYRDWIDTVERPHVEALDAAAPPDGPLISVLVPVYDTPEMPLRRCIESVLAQSYPRWELCIVDDASRMQHVRRILDEYADERIRLTYRERNGHICRTSNDALAMARGDFVALLDHDDELARHALLEVARAIAEHPEAELLYSDEDKLRVDGVREEPHFKPRFDPDLLLGQNYMGHLLVARTARVREVGGFRLGYEGSQDHDLALRITERLRPEQVVHIPWVLYHWRMSAESTAAAPDAKGYTAEAGIRAVRDALERRDLPATVEHAEVAHSYRVQPVLSELPLVSIIIPTRDALELVSVCIDSLLSKTNYGHFEVIVVDNGTTDSAALGYLDGVRRVERVRVLRDDRPFNFSALNNRAVEQASGRVLCLLNNDIEIIEPGWLTQLVAHAVRPDVGCVGAKLLFPDDTIQHAGVLLGLHGLAGHPYRRMSARHPGYYGRLTVTHGISAVTAACLVVERDIYRKLGGFDEQLAVAFNDVDFCIKVREAGYRNVMVPTVALVHHESATRGLDQARLKRQRFMREVERMKERWGGLLYDDPHYSPHLSLEHDDYSLRIAK